MIDFLCVISQVKRTLLYNLLDNLRKRTLRQLFKMMISNKKLFIEPLH